MNTASIFKKMATIVAIVGSGLLAAPLEQAEAQTGIPEVIELCIVSNEASDYELRHGWADCRVNWDVSSILSASLEWQIGATARPSRGPFYDPPDADKDGRTAYGTMLFYPKNFDDEITNRDEWIQIFFYVSTGPNASVSAWVEDSDGNEYDIDVRIVF